MTLPLDSGESINVPPLAGRKNKTPPERGFHEERLKGLEPSTFCMASRRSSQLSYSREADAEYIGGARTRRVDPEANPACGARSKRRPRRRAWAKFRQR